MESVISLQLENLYYLSLLSIYAFQIIIMRVLSSVRPCAAPFLSMAARLVGKLTGTIYFIL